MRKVFWMTLLFCGTCLQSAIYYVSPDGNNKNPGTDPRFPLKSITSALRKVKSGDTVMLKGGIYREQIAYNFKDPNLQPITIKAFPDETPVITWGWDVKNWKKIPGGLFSARFPYAVCELWQRITLDRYLKVNSMALLKKQPGSFWQDEKTGMIYVNPLNGSWHADPENAGFVAIPFTTGIRPSSLKSTSRSRRTGISLVGKNLHIDGISLEYHSDAAFYLRGRQKDLFYGSGSVRNSTALGSNCGFSVGWYVDGFTFENCLSLRNSGAGIHLGAYLRNIKVVNNLLLNNGSSLPFYGNYKAGGGHVYNLARYGDAQSYFVDVIGNKILSLDKSRKGGVMRFKSGISRHTNQLNNLFAGSGAVLYSVPGSTATIRNNTVISGKFNFTVPNTGEKYTPDMKDNLELVGRNWKKSVRFVNPEKYDYRLLPDSKYLGKGFAPSPAPVWFVKPGTKGGDGGTPEKALNSLALLQTKVKSGDTVYFMKGNYTGHVTFKNLKNVTFSDKSFNTASWKDFSIAFENCSGIRLENMDFRKGNFSFKNSVCEFLENLFADTAFAAQGGKVVFANNRLEHSSIKSSGRVVFRENIINMFKVDVKEGVSEHNGFMTAQELKKWAFKESFKSFVAGVNGRIPLKNVVCGSRGTWIGGRAIPDRIPPLVLKYARVTPLSCGTKAVVSWETPKDYVQAYVTVRQGTKLVCDGRVPFGDYLSTAGSFCIPGLKPGLEYKVLLRLARHNEETSAVREFKLVMPRKKQIAKSSIVEVGPGKKYTSVAEAVLSASNGSTILVAPGIYPEMINVYADNITIKASKPGTVKFSAEYMFDYVIRAANVKGLTVDGIDFTGGRYSARAKMIDITRSEKIRILNCRFFPGVNRKMSNLQICGRYVKGFEVRNCVFDKGFHSLWLMESGDVVVDHNTFWGIGINAIHVGGGDGAKVTITNNLCQDVVSNHNSPAISVGHRKIKLVCNWNLYWFTRKHCPKQKVFGWGGKLGIHAVGQVMRQDSFVTIEECRKHYGVEKNGLFADPKMKDPEQGDFSLAADSPARKRGSDGKDIGADLTVWGK